MSRRRIIAGNWKMNKTPSEAVALCAELKDLVKNDAVDVVYCVPAIDIVPVVEAVKGTNVHVGAENFYYRYDIDSWYAVYYVYSIVYY